MIYGTGVDLVGIKRMEKVLIRWEDRFVKRVFTDREAYMCRHRPAPHAAFALRFAAKKAFSKALGLGMRGGSAGGISRSSTSLRENLSCGFSTPPRTSAARKASAGFI